MKVVNQGLIQDALVRFCQDPEIWQALLKLPHPDGMIHQFRNTPLSLGDFAWSSTMNPTLASKNAKRIVNLLEESPEFGCFDGFGKRDQENTRDFFNKQSIKNLVKTILQAEEEL